MHHLIPNRNYEQHPPAVFPPLDAVAWGFDFYGLWKTLEVAGVHQTMRWIPPGDFKMGSPKDELGRDDDELLHSVKLTMGFWLADTACTQQLWQSVTGNNPSDFKGEFRPVENISWNEATEFLQSVSSEQSTLVLPTEAQWEYACRANTDTPFNCGKNIDPTMVNYLSLIHISEPTRPY